MAVNGESKFSKEPHSPEVQILKLKAEIEALRRFVPSVVREAIAQNPVCLLLERQMCDLTVLFMDIAGCTRLCEILPSERMHDLIEGYFSSFIDEVHHLGGTINETAGDGLMILFLGGGPKEHAQAAARAASLIHARTKEFVACSDEECQDIAVHIGINTGSASLGMMEFRGKREVRATYTASAPVTNIAARLAALASGGKTYIGEETWERTGGRFHGFHAGQFDLKNVSQPVGVYEVREERFSDSSF